MHRMVLRDRDGNPLPSDIETVKQELAEYLGFVGRSEIADRAGVSVAAVDKWRQRHDDFPEPVAELAMGPLWIWADVEPWVESRRARGRPADDSK